MDTELRQLMNKIQEGLSAIQISKARELYCSTEAPTVKYQHVESDPTIWTYAPDVPLNDYHRWGYLINVLNKYGVDSFRGNPFP